MNEHTLKILEFDKLINMLASRCQTELGAEKVFSLRPKSNIEIARHLLQQTGEIKSLMDTDGSVPFRAIHNVKQELAVAKVGSVLNVQDFLKIQITLNSLSILSGYFSNNKERCPIVSKMALSYESFTELSSIIEKSINYEGYVLDGASVNLGKIRNEIKILEARIKEKINSIVTSPKYRTYLQEPIITTRSDRYCIPVKAEYKSSVPGIVHDSSGSGSTLYIEPGAIVDSGNKLKEAFGKEKEEIYKILSNLSNQVGEKADSISYAVDISADIDIITAKAILSYDMKATEPKLNDRGKIVANLAKHPLIQGEVAPIDINLGGRFDCLLITGPNTGGKTVTLKTVGLICLMAMCGIQVPCENGSELSTFSQIFADIGDEQSIEQSLSTFSGHMKNIVNITENANAHSLILLDELGAGTDPTEGAALAQSIILDLINKKAKIIATTHYGELKKFAFTTDRIENASVEFDTVTLKPTYKLLIGIPGSSNAFHIASRMGINENIIENAQQFVENKTDASEEIIAKIEESHKEAAADRIEAGKKLREIEDLKSDYKRQLEQLKYQQNTIEDKIRKKANKIIREYTEEIEKTLENLKNTTEENTERQDLRKKTSKLIEDFSFKLNSSMPSIPKKEYIKVDENLKIGDIVFVTTLETKGAVEQISGKNAIVSVNSIKMAIPIEKLAKAEEDNKENTLKKGGTYTELALEKSKTFKNEINLLGMRAEDAIYQLDKFIDAALACNAEKIRVVHGKGTGALRSAVRLYLNEHDFIKDFSLAEHNEGGDGATNVFLKR